MGEIPADSLSVVEGAAGGSCGVVSRIYLVFDKDGRLGNCTALVKGRDVAYATASALIESARGLTVLDAARLGLNSLHPDFAQISEDDRERALVVEDAFHHALGAVVRKAAATGETVPGASLDALIAMSGGVDSAVTLHEGHAAHAGNVAGCTLRLWIDPKSPDPDRACCAPESVRRARATCQKLGVPHFGIDLSGPFADAVVAPFIESYKSGETPNPCVRCNGSFRLDGLVRIADAVSASHIWTGHYARTDQRGDTMLVRRGVDRRKDQSYMLATVAPETLRRFVFPLGDREKPQIRAKAAKLGLEQAKIRDSQEVCFLGGGNYRDFLTRMNALGPAGTLVDEAGEELGSHEGLAGFTPGQRKGVAAHLSPKGSSRAASTGPLYVIGTDPRSGTVTVGPRQRLGVSSVNLRDAVDRLDGTTEVEVQLRYRAGDDGIRATVDWHDDGRATLHLATPAMAPAPGQLACMYDEAGCVVGIGTIDRP
jgi:tRNA-specific 2-thiouridylase